MKAVLLDLKIFFVLSLLALFLFFLDNFNLLNLPKTVVQFLTTPIQYGLYKNGLVVKSQFEIIGAIRLQAQENIALKKQLGDLTTKNALLQKQLNQALVLVDQQNSLPPSTFNLTPSHIIGIGRFLTIDKGSLDGIKINQTVVFKDNFVGKIKEVSPKSSKVLLPQDPDSKLSVFASDRAGKAKGILVGQFGSDILMDKVLHQEPLNLDDLVYSEGTEGDVPRGLIIGKISKVLENQNQVFKQGQVIQLYKIDDLDIVSIIVGS